MKLAVILVPTAAALALAVSPGARPVPRACAPARDPGYRLLFDGTAGASVGAGIGVGMGVISPEVGPGAGGSALGISVGMAAVSGALVGVTSTVPSGVALSDGGTRPSSPASNTSRNAVATNEIRRGPRCSMRAQ